MKTKIALLLLLVSGTFFAQTSQTLQPDVKKLYVAFDEIDLDALTEMLCTADRQTVYGKLDAHFLNDTQKFRFVFTNAKFNYSDIKIINGEPFCGITFRNVVRITYFSAIDVAQVHQLLKNKFRAQSVVYEKARNAFLIVYNAKMIAHQDSSAGRWKFAFADDTIPQEISAGCVTNEIKNQLGLQRE
jgi:hypothetical protein